MTNCKNCGAPLPSYPCKCEYCGTEYGKIDERDEEDEEYLYADGEVIARATSAGIMTVNEARRYFGLEEPKDPKTGEVWVRSYY